MKNKLLTVTICIPAFNEEANIRQLIDSILMQEEKGFVLEKIIIRSDASTDSTEAIVKEFKDKRIELIAGKERLGKALGLNVMFDKAQSDLAIPLDADSIMINKNVLSNIISEFRKKGLDLGAVKIKPIKATTNYENLLEYSTQLKHKIFEKINDGDNWFTCCGIARVMNKKFYKNIKFENIAGEDMFSYLFAKKNNYKYGYLDSATIYYKLSNNPIDHRKQNQRFNSAVKQLKESFGEEFFNRYYSMYPKRATLIIFKELFNDPIGLISYLTIFFIFRAKDTIRPKKINGLWNISQSSRKVAI